MEEKHHYIFCDGSHIQHNFIHRLAAGEHQCGKRRKWLHTSHTQQWTTAIDATKDAACGQIRFNNYMYNRRVCSI
jgi:hypothetical protein